MSGQRRLPSPSSSSCSRSSPLVGFAAARWRRAEDMPAPGRVGPGRPRLRHVRHLVPARRRPLHRLHLHRGARRWCTASGAAGFFAVPYTIIVFPIVFVFAPRLWSVCPGARLRHPRRLRPRPVRLPRPGAGRRGDRHPGHHALHRPAAGRHPGGARRSWGWAAARATRSSRTCRCSSPSSCWPPTPSCPGCARPALIAFVKDTLIYVVIIVAVIYIPTRLGGWSHIFSHRGRAPGHDQPQDRQAVRLAGHRRPPASGPTPPWPSARRWRCSCTRTRSPACWPPSAATSSGATWRSCRPTR